MAAAARGRFAASVGRVSSRLAWLGAATLASMTVLSFADVLGRELVSSPIAAKVEATELAMGLIVFLGVGSTTFLRGHIRVDVLIVRLPRRWRAALDAATHALAILFAAAVCWRLGELALVRLEQGGVTQIWEVPLWPVAVAMAACSAVMLAALVVRWVEDIRAAAGPDPSRPEWTRSS